MVLKKSEISPVRSVGACQVCVPGVCLCLLSQKTYISPTFDLYTKIIFCAFLLH